MIFLLLDYLLSFFSIHSLYLIILNIILIPKEKYPKFLIITLILDLLILNTYFLNTLIFFLIFHFYKHLKIIKVNFLNYFISLNILYFLYILILGLVTSHSLYFIGTYLLKSYLPSFIFYFLCYKILKKNIKLSR